MITTLALTSWTIAAVALCWSAHRARLAQTPTPDPEDPADDTADDYADDDDVQRIYVLPPVPLPAAWDDGDEAAFRWFALGCDR